MKLRALIIDDEEYSRIILRSLIQDNLASEIEIVGEADSVKNAIETINQEKPDIVFLDIQLGDGLGFDVLKKITYDRFETIFVTAYDRYAIQAFECSAFGYILKPIKSEKLINVVQRFIDKNQNNQQVSNDRLKVLEENFQGKFLQRLILSDQKGFHIVSLDDILFVRGDGSYSHFHCSNDRKITVSKNIGSYDQLLSDRGFFRIHQGYLINLIHVDRYSNDLEVIMANGESLKLSRHRKTDFLKQFIK